MKANGKIGIDELQKIIAFSQTAFGIYLAKFISELFKLKNE